MRIGSINRKSEPIKMMAFFLFVIMLFNMMIPAPVYVFADEGGSLPIVENAPDSGQGELGGEGASNEEGKMPSGDTPAGVLRTTGTAVSEGSEIESGASSGPGIEGDMPAMETTGGGIETTAPAIETTEGGIGITGSAMETTVPAVGTTITAIETDAVSAMMLFGGSSLPQLFVTASGIAQPREYDGRPLKAVYVYDGLLPGHSLVVTATAISTVQFDSEGNVTGAPVQISDLCVLDAQGLDVTTGYAVNTAASGMLTLMPRALTLALTDITKAYDGAPLTSAAFTTISGSLVQGDRILYIDTSGSELTTVGSIVNRAIGALIENGDGIDVTGCYGLTIEEGTLTVVPGTTNLKVAGYTGAYDGLYHTVSLPYYVADSRDRIFYYGTTDSAIDTESITDWQTEEAAFRDPGTYYVHVKIENDNYNLRMGKERVTIVPRTITLRANEATKVYDGKALSYDGYMVIGGSLVQTGDITSTMSGIRVTDDSVITDVGIKDNRLTTADVRITETFSGGTRDVTDYYNFVLQPGHLEVTRATAAMTVLGYEGYYDGQSHGITIITDAKNGDRNYYSVTDGALMQPVTDTAYWSTDRDAIKFVDAGTHKAYVKIINDNYFDRVAEVDSIIYKRPLSLVVRNHYETYDPSRDYHSVPLSSTRYAIFAGTMAAGDVITEVQTDGRLTTLGSVNNHITGIKIYEGLTDNTHNYAITSMPGILALHSSGGHYLDLEGYYGVYDGNPHSISINSTALETAGFTIFYSTDGGATWQESVNPAFSEVTYSGINTVGAYRVHVKAEKDGYSGLNGSATVQILPRELVISPESKAKIFDGTPVTAGGFSRLSGDLLAGHNMSVTTSGMTSTLSAVGWIENVVTDYAVIASVSGIDKTGNYKIANIPGRLEVIKGEPLVQLYGYTVYYDGYPKTIIVNIDPNLIMNEEPKITYSIDGGSSYSFEKPTITNVGEMRVKVKVEDVDSNYFDYDGEIVVTVEKRPVSFAAASAARRYTGQPLTAPNYGIGGMGLADTDYIERDKIVVSGSITDAGDAPNVITSDSAFKIMTSGSGIDVTSNYEVSWVNGTLAIIPADSRVMVTGYTGVYDGMPHSVKINPAMMVTGYAIEYSADVINWQNEEITYTDVTTAEVYIRVGGLNYESVTASAVVKIYPLTLDLSAKKETIIYDGREISGGFQAVSGQIPSADTVAVKFSTDGGISWGDDLTRKYVGQTAYSITGASITASGGAIDRTGNYIITYKDGGAGGLLQVNKRPLTITAASDSKEYDGTALVNGGFYTTGGGMGLAIGDVIDDITVTGSQITVGSSSNIASGASVKNGAVNVTDNYDITYVNGNLTVEKKKIITISTASISRTYDGTPLKAVDAPVQYSVTSSSGLLAGHQIIVTVSAVRTIAGATVNQADYRIIDGNQADMTANYQVEEKWGKLTVKEKAITVTTQSIHKPVYDGVALTNGAFQITYSDLAAGDEIFLTPTGSQLPAGSSQNGVDVVIKNASSTAVTGSYTVDRRLGILSVSPRAITITIRDDVRDTYDGTPKTITDSSIAAGALATGDAITEVTGAVFRTTAGSIEIDRVNTTIMASSGAAAERNRTGSYVITYIAGTLEVTQKAITITALDLTKVYDGTPLTGRAFTTTAGGMAGLATGDYVVPESLVFDGSQTVSGSSVNNVRATAGGIIIRNMADADVSGSYSVNYAPGTLTVTPRTVTVTALSDAKIYDAKPLTNTSYSAVGLAAGDVLTVTMGGVITTAGSVINTIDDFRIMRGGTDVTANYSVTTVSGILTVSRAALTLTANSDSKMYDANPLTNTSYSAVGLAAGDEITIGSVTVTGSQTFAGVSANVIAPATPGGIIILNNGGLNVADSYIISYVNGTLTVSQAGIGLTITAGSFSKVYDGTALEGRNPVATGGSPARGWTTTGAYTVGGALATGDLLTVTMGSVITTAGSVINTIDDFKIMHGATDVTANYNVVTADGTLAVSQAALTLTANSSSRTYDGTPLTNAGYSATGLASGDAIRAGTVTVTGSQTAVGTTTNAIAPTTGGIIILNGGGTDVTGSYAISYVNGTLTVKDKASSGGGGAAPVIEEEKVTVTLTEADGRELEIFYGNIEKGELENGNGSYGMIEGGRLYLDGVPGRTGYNFTGWFLDEGLTERVFNIPIPESGEVILYAGWAEIPQLNTEDHFAYMQGYPDGAFLPLRSMSRAEVVVMFSRLLTEHINDEWGTDSNFSDVDQNAWYAPAVGFMERLGIIRGDIYGNCRPNDPITRAEFAAIASRFDNLTKGLDGGFSDVPEDHWAYEAISFAAAKGWVSGYPDGTFRPDNYINRAEVVTVTNNMVIREGDRGYVDDNYDSLYRTYNDIDNAYWAYYEIMESSESHDHSKDQEELWLETYEEYPFKENNPYL